MYTVKTYNEIAQKGLDVFTNDYKINTGENPDAILLRSYNLHDELIPSSVILYN